MLGLVPAILLLIAGILGAVPVPNGTRIAWILVAIAGAVMLAGPLVR